MSATPLTKQRPAKHSHRRLAGVAQLSMVEHALFPLGQELRDGQAVVHDTNYSIRPRGKRPVTTEVTIHASLGIKPFDERILHGLLGLALAEPDPQPVFYATTNFILDRLGLANGGRAYADFDAACRRLEVLNYVSSPFYHPVQQELVEHISFGFLKRCIPLRNEAERGWKFVFDQQFFEIIRHTSGRIRFPYDVYAQCSPSEARLYLFLRKLMHRFETTPTQSIHHLNDTIMGLQSDVPGWRKKQWVAARCRTLLKLGVIALPPNVENIES